MYGFDLLSATKPTGLSWSLAAGMRKSMAFGFNCLQEGRGSEAGETLYRGGSHVPVREYSPQGRASLKLVVTVIRVSNHGKARGLDGRSTTDCIGTAFEGVPPSIHGDCTLEEVICVCDIIQARPLRCRSKRSNDLSLRLGHCAMTGGSRRCVHAHIPPRSSSQYE